MSKLILERFKCIEDTNEYLAESPYFLFFVAEVNGSKVKSDVKFIRRESWDNSVNTGDTYITNITVSEGMRHDLVLVAMVEEDGDADFGFPMTEVVATHMKKFCEDMFKRVATGPDETTGGLIRDEFERFLTQSKCDDEILGVRRLTPADMKKSFRGDGGNYLVTFKFA